MTSNAIPVTFDWMDLNTASGIAAGSAATLHNVSGANDIIRYAISDLQPAVDFEGAILSPHARSVSIGAGLSTVWIRVSRQNGQVSTTAAVQFSDEDIYSAPISGSIVIAQENPVNKTLSTDAWSRQKAIIDDSIVHGMFTFNVPAPTWKESINAIEQTSFTNATSIDGKLNLTSNGVLNDKVKLDTFRNPRYEPNRGHLYSSSMFLPSPDALGQRTFGVFTEDSGVGFRLKSDGNLYAVRRTTLSGVPADTETLITVPDDVNLDKGNTFDIQFQWRGVGNYFYFINQKLVLFENVLGTLDELSLSDPASPIAFECINQGADVVMQCGCVDVSSEGGEDNGKTYGSVSVNSQTGSVAINGFDIPVVVVRNKSMFGTAVNTRDVLSLLATGYADQRCVLRVWATRDETAITLNNQVWADFGDAHIDRIVYALNADGTALVGTAMTFDTSKAQLVFGARVNQDNSYATSALFEGRTEIYQTPGDIFIFTMHRETGAAANVGVTYEFAESI